MNAQMEFAKVQKEERRKLESFGKGQGFLIPIKFEEKLKWENLHQPFGKISSLSRYKKIKFNLKKEISQKWN